MNKFAPENQDVKNSLEWLGAFQIIFGLLLAAICGAITYFGIVLFLAGPMEDENGHGPPFPGLLMLFGIVIAPVSLCGVILGLSLCASAVAIAKWRVRRFSLIVAYFTCAVFPVGTLLGIWAVKLLSRTDVTEAYARNEGEPSDGANRLPAR